MQLEHFSSVKTKNKFYDFNSLLKVANVLVFILSVYFYQVKGPNEYVNTFTLALAGMLAIENIGMLYYEKKRTNPFIIILVFLTTFFYIARVATLIAIPKSFILERALVTSQELNYALIFILFCNASMFLGFYISEVIYLKQKTILTVAEPFPKLRNLSIILMIVVLLIFLGSIGMSNAWSGSITAIFFNQHVILLFSFVFFCYYYSKNPHIFKWFIILLIASLAFLLTYAGSRAGILTIGYLVLIAILVVKQRVLISKKTLLILIILVPTSIFFYIIATFNRSLEEKETNVIKLLDMVDEEFSSANGYLEQKMGLVFERIGFLDYSTALMARKEIYLDIINVEYYTLSIIDNVLTPGFDIFDTPKASHALGYLADGREIPPKEQISLAYQSDQMGIYGEYYVMFLGYTALVAFFFLAAIFQWTYYAFGTSNFLISCLYRALLLNIFYMYINSYGTDWMVFELVSTVFTSFLFMRFYVYSKERKELIQES